MKKNIKNIAMTLLILTTAILITMSAIMYDQSFFRTLPLYISLLVMLFKSEANRLAPLIGSINSILYAIVDFSYGLYGTAIIDISVSFTIQLATFILWTKRKDGKTTKFRKMRPHYRFSIVLLMIAIYIPCLRQNQKLGATMAPLDTYAFVDGLVSPGLTLFAFIEYTYLLIIGCTVTVIMNVLMLKETPDRLSYLVYSIYSLICCTMACVNVHKAYKRQREEAIDKENKNEA
jgi:nicotinamide riboside transporter PnuC